MIKLRGRLYYLGVLAILIAGFHLLSGQRALMNAIVSVTLPLRQMLGRLCSAAPFSIAELLCTLGVLAIPAWLIWTICSVVRARPRWPILVRRCSLLLAVVMTLYLLLCLLLGASYRADGFQEKSGLAAAPSDVDTLAAVTMAFADRLLQAADTVARDEDGCFAVEQDTLFSQAVTIYRGAEACFPLLTLRDTPPKRAFYSHLMTVTNYTGFYFPFTGEAHINTQPPAALLPATIAHEMAHQRGIASEQEANFIAILACTESGNDAYAYSGWLFGFLHLGNALYRHDPDTYYALASRLPDGVWSDLRANDAFWAQYDTRAAQVSETMYDGLLKSYGQSLGVQSYGAVVDLLIAWYLAGGLDGS